MTSFSYNTKDLCNITVAQVIGRLGGGGAQRLAFNLAVALKAFDICSLVIALREGGDFIENDTSVIDAHILDIYPRNIVSLLRGALALRRKVQSLGINLLHVHGADCLLFCDLALSGMLQRPSIVFTWHDSESVLTSTGWRRHLMLRALRRCDCVFGSSKSVAARLSSALNPSFPIKEFVNGVPCGPLPQRSKTDIPHLIWAGRLVPPKAPLALINAVAYLKNEGLIFRVTLLGDAPPGMEWYEAKVRDKIQELNLEKMLVLPGWVSEIQAELAEADIAVQTSQTEGLSMALLEQMMAGLAIVATDVGDTAQALNHGECGLLIPAEDEEALSQALRKLILDSELRLRLGTAAHERARKVYSLQAMAKRALAHYQVCLTQRGSCD